ncbi:MAG: phosphoenolpyruvate--protein phosphotransferase [Acidimicrobiales bacterium]|nr:phosphoenolpyruvate--protein phosphotransferase [Acidimicrobiales bacterium]
MSTLSEHTVQLGAAPATKDEAIGLAADLLARAGHIDPAYGDSMRGREKVANTYLGEGIAIPHGLGKDRDLIKSTGLAVVQVPGGVEWNPGEQVRLVVGIAAASDEHLQILANLTRVLADPALVDKLATTDDPAVVVDSLTGGAGSAAGTGDGSRPGATGPGATDAANAAGPGTQASADPSAGADLAGYAAVDVVVRLAQGLHARPATELVDVAKGFASDIRVRHGDRIANGKSLGSLLTLGAGSGATVTLLAKGDDEDAALEALRAAVEGGLGEGDGAGGPGVGAPGAGQVAGEGRSGEGAAGATPPGDTAPDLAVPAFRPTGDAVAVPGVAASPGLAIGPLWHLKRRRLVVERTAGDVRAEQARLREAIESARAELTDLHDEVAARSGAGEAAIFRAHAAFLDDPDLVDAVDRIIRDGHSAGWAWREAIAARVEELRRVDDATLAARAVDLGDVGERVLRYLAATDEEDPKPPDHPVILVADDLTPSDTAGIDPATVVGFATASGGPTSHTAIIARALGIPALVGVGPALLSQPAGAVAVLDGDAGTLWVGVGDTDLDAARQAQEGRADVRAEEHRTRYQPAMTTDGHRVEVVANIGAAAEAALAVEAGAEGVGLLRTEFLFLGRDAPPDEEEQVAALTEMVRALNGLPLVVRTLDIGGDKQVPYIDLPAEEGSFLGIRGVRLSLARPDLFHTQLRAIYRASQAGPVSIMFPMIARLEDLDAAVDHAERARVEVGADPVDLGVMIEVPSAALMAAELAARVDFLSIGTNDLTQYVLAMDRTHPVLARQADALHPAVLRLIRQVVEAAAGSGAWVGVCGGVAGEPEGALVLTGLGVDELSVAVPAVAAVKARLRDVSRTAAEDLARRALTCTTAGEVRRLVLP